MRIEVSTTEAKSILTRTSGYLKTVSSHSLQPYRGCSFGQSLCGVGCYVQHSSFITKGARWGGFLVAKLNAAALYLAHHQRERRWAHRRGASFGVFMSSSTDPFVPHEQRFRITREVLRAMLDHPPDVLIVQTHTHLVGQYTELLSRLSEQCAVRVHLSIESDRDRLPGLPPPASSVEKRFAAARALKKRGIRTVITVAPLLPIAEPERFFSRIGVCADSVVIDHFIGGDGTKDGSRTANTGLPRSMALVDRESLSIEYRDKIVETARRLMPGRVGIGVDGFAGRCFS